MNKEEVLKIALDCDFDHFASDDAEWLDCSIDDLVYFANAIRERAAVECEKVAESIADEYEQTASLLSGIDAIRALKVE